MIFAREITDDLTSLVKEINATVTANKDKKMAAFTVVLTVVITLLTRRSFAQLESRVAEEDKQMALVR